MKCDRKILTRFQLTTIVIHLKFQIESDWLQFADLIDLASRTLSNRSETRMANGLATRKFSFGIRYLMVANVRAGLI